MLKKRRELRTKYINTEKPEGDFGLFLFQHMKRKYIYPAVILIVAAILLLAERCA